MGLTLLYLISKCNLCWNTPYNLNEQGQATVGCTDKYWTKYDGRCDTEKNANSTWPILQLKIRTILTDKWMVHLKKRKNSVSRNGPLTCISCFHVGPLKSGCWVQPVPLVSKVVAVTWFVVRYEKPWADFFQHRLWLVLLLLSGKMLHSVCPDLN